MRRVRATATTRGGDYPRWPAVVKPRGGEARRGTAATQRRLSSRMEPTWTLARHAGAGSRRLPAPFARYRGHARGDSLDSKPGSLVQRLHDLLVGLRDTGACWLSPR